MTNEAVRGIFCSGFKLINLSRTRSSQIRDPHKTIMKRNKSKLIWAAAQCLKITEKVSFNIASEASYVYIFSGQKFTKNAKNSHFSKPVACGLKLLPDRSMGGKC